jgi:spore coat protein H
MPYAALTVLAMLGQTVQAQKEFYDPDTVQTVHLEVAEEDTRRMLAALPKRIYVPATFRYGDVSIDRVAIRFKGNSSSSPEQRHKRSYLIKFSEYEKDQRFLGLRRISLDNGVQFGSLFSEPIITEILQDQGIPTHRCNYAKLFVNDKYQGVYTNVERIDESFVESRFDGGKGPLFKIDLGGPGANLQFLGNDPALYGVAFEPKSKSAEKDAWPLVDFVRMVNKSSKSEFAANLESQFEVDDFLKIASVMLFSGAFDQLTGWNAHNYYLYHDSDEKRWRYLPWDLDVGFCEIAFGQIHVLADWNAAWPIPGNSQNPLLERIIADPELLARYRHSASLILDKYFKPEQLCTKINAKYALIKADLENDPFPHQRATNRDKNFDEVVASQKDFVRKRYAAAREQLDNPGARPKFARRQPQNRNEPMPGPASKDAPTELRVVDSSSSGVKLEWKDNATAEAGHILQRAEGAKGTEFRNYMGKPGDKISEATDPRVEAGKTYRYRVFAVRHTPRGPQGSGVSNVVTVRVE